MSEISETVLDSRLVPTQHVVALQALHAAPQRAGAVVGRMPAAGHEWRASGEAWSIRMLLAHLAGSEAPFYRRLQTILTEANPFLPYFGPEVARPEAEGSAEVLLEAYGSQRQRLVKMLADLRPEDWERQAVHETMGPTTLALQVQNIVNHDTDHYEQLVETARGWEQRRDA